jgi:hypothetical protein
MAGGLDRDVFRFLDVGDSGRSRTGRDVIEDFARGDKIDLSAIDARGGGADNHFAFRDTGGFTGAGEVRVDYEYGKTIVELNTKGAGGAEMTIELIGTFDLSAGDFIL